MRGVCFTLNNWSNEEFDALQTLSLKNTNYGIIGKEIGKSGNMHLQGFIYFKNDTSMKALKKINPRAHWEEKYKNSLFKDASNYCKKGEQSKEEWEELKDKGPNFGKNADFIEWGKLPMDQKEKGDEGKKAIQERWELARQGLFDQLPPEQIKTYEYIHRKYQSVEDRDSLDNLWIYGVSGAGKSRMARDMHENIYVKMMNKWWDGYNHEDVVLLDDFAPEHGSFLAYYLKIWTDHYAFNAEVKGGSMQIRPKKFIITSQYTIEECFMDPKTVEALQRRFKQFHKT